MRVVKKAKKIVSLILCAGILMSGLKTMPLQLAYAQENTGTYTMFYDESESEIYKTDSYDITAPVVLDTGITKDGYAFAGWNMIAADETVKYYKLEEKILTDDEDMLDGVDYYIKSEVYSPLSCYLINGITSQVVTDAGLKAEILAETGLTEAQFNNNYASLMIVGDNLTNVSLYCYYNWGTLTDASTAILKEVGNNFTLSFDIVGNAIRNPILSNGDSSFSPSSVGRYTTFAGRGTGDIINNINYPGLVIAANKLFEDAYITRPSGNIVQPNLTDGNMVYLDMYSCLNAGSEVWQKAAEVVGIPAIVSDTNLTNYGYQYYYPVEYNSLTMSSLNSYFVSIDRINNGMTSSTSTSAYRLPVYYKDASKSAVVSVATKEQANGSTIYYKGKTEVTKDEYDSNVGSAEYTTDTDSNEITEENVSMTPAVLYKTVKYYPIWLKYLTEFDISKTYLNSYDNTQNVIPGDNTVKEDITFTITPFVSYNREVVSVADQTLKTEIPAFSEAVYTITADDGDDKVTVELPEFTDELGVGDYWYEVSEIEGTTAGVIYDANKYYIHIVVTRDSESTIGVSQVTMHKTAPDDETFVNEENDKTGTLTNEFASGSLTVEKLVKGNMGDKNKLFKVVIELNAPTGKTVMGDIRYTGGFTEDGEAVSETVIAGSWTGTKTIEVYLKDGASVEFSNIPDGVTYTIYEDDYSADGYKNPEYAFDNASEAGDAAASGDSWSANKANGTISDEEDIVVITNTKESSIDVGVIVEYYPYVILFVIAIAGGVILFIKRRRDEII